MRIGILLGSAFVLALPPVAQSHAEAGAGFENGNTLIAECDNG
jgi:hypothetical protein